MGNTATVTFSVNTPTIATRAVGDGKTATKLYVAVYENQNGTASNLNLVGPLDASFIGQDNEHMPKTFTDRVAQVNLQLAKNKEYSVIFWAQSDSSMFTVDWEGRELSLKTPIYANAEGYDAFWAQKTVTITGALTETVELKRPFAQLNIGTSDKAAAADAGIVVTQSQVVVKKVPTTFNLQTGAVSNEQDVTYTMASIEGIKNENFPAVAAGQQYLSLNYLPMAVDKSIVDIEFQYKDEQDNDAYVLNFPSVPVQRNFRTNIYGTLLTNSANYTVEIKPGFGNDGEEDAGNIVYASTAEELQAALNAAAEDSTIKVVLLNDITLNGQTAAYTTNAKNVIIESNGAATTRSGNSKKFTLTFKDSYRTYFGLANKDAKVTFNNVNIYRETTGGTHWHDNNMKFTCNAEFNNVDFNKGICFDNAKTFVMNNCSINKGKVATYALFITAGCDVTIDGLSVTHSEGVAGRGIKIVDEDVAEKDALTTLSVSNATFVTEEKAAILVGSQGGAKITLSNLDLTGVKADQFNAVWVDEDYKGISVEVEGGFCVTEGETQTEETIFVDGATVEVSGNLVIPEGKVKDLDNFTLIGVGEDATIQVSGLAFTGDNVKIKGLNIVNDGKSDCALSLSGKNPVVEDCVFTGAAGNGNGVVIAGNGEDNVITLKNCDFSQDDFFKPIFDGWNGLDGGTLVIDGCTLANGLYTMHIDANGESGNIVIKNSTLNGFTTNGASLESISFENCTFGVAAGYACVNMYTSHSFTNCTFPTKADANNTGNYGLYVASNAKGDVMVMNDCMMSDGTPITAANMAVADGGFLHWDSEAAACVWTVNGQRLIATSAQLASAVAAMDGTEATFLLAKGTFALPTSFGGKTLHLEGVDKEATILEMTKTGSSLPQYGGTKLSCNNMTVKRALGDYQGFQGQEEHYDNCIISGRLMTYSPLVTANECTFLPGASDDYNVQIYEAGTATFTNCKFNAYKGRSVYAYAESAKEMNITFTGCEFTSVNGKNENNFAPAIRLHTELGINGKLTINNCTNDDNFNTAINGGLWVEWNNSTKKLTNNFVKTINGAPFVNADVYTAAQLKAAIADAQAGDVITLADGTYEGEFDLTHKNLTIKSVSESFEPVIKGLVWADNCTVTLEGLKLTNPNGVQHPNPQNSQYYNTINKQSPLVGAYNNAEIKFVDCTFDIVAPTVYGFYGYAHNSPVFEDCTFNCNNIRPIASNGPALTVTGCTFNDQYHYSVRIFENSEEKQTIVYTNNTIQGSNDKGEFEGINISKKGNSATVLGDFTIKGNTNVKYRHHSAVTMSANCTYDTDIANFAFESE